MAEPATECPAERGRVTAQHTWSTNFASSHKNTTHTTRGRVPAHSSSMGGMPSVRPLPAVAQQSLLENRARPSNSRKAPRQCMNAPPRMKTTVARLACMRRAFEEISRARIEREDRSRSSTASVGERLAGTARTWLGARIGQLREADTFNMGAQATPAETTDLVH